MERFDFERVKEVRVEGLFNFALIVDAHQDGDAFSLLISGSAATSVVVQSEGAVVSVQGQDAPPPARRSKSSSMVSMSGTFITGNIALPVASVPREPLRIRYGGFGEAPVRIEVALPPGQRVVLHGPFATVTTAAPRERAGEASGDQRPGPGVLPPKVRAKAEELLGKAREERRDGSLGGAIRAHALETEARALLDGEVPEK